jgi:hypothetical protein
MIKIITQLMGIFKEDVTDVIKQAINHLIDDIYRDL